MDGLPQALMITGRLYDEATVLRVALAYERATKWHTMHPLFLRYFSTVAFLMKSSFGYSLFRYALPCSVILPWSGTLSRP